jgi:hypothetical protein
LLEQFAFERPAPGWAFRIDLTPLATKARTWLVETLLPSFAKQTETKFCEQFGIIPALKLNIPKQNAIATQTTGRTKFADGIGRSAHHTIESWMDTNPHGFSGETPVQNRPRKLAKIFLSTYALQFD